MASSLTAPAMICASTSPQSVSLARPFLLRAKSSTLPAPTAHDLRHLRLDTSETGSLLATTPHSSLPPAPGDHHSTFYASWKWNHTALVLLCLAYFTKHNILKVHLVAARVRIAFLFKAEHNSVVWLDHIPCIRSSIHERWSSTAFSLWTWVDRYLLESLLSILLGVYPDVGLLGHIAILFKLLGNRHTAFHPNINVTSILLMDSSREGGQTPAPGEGAKVLAAESSLRGPRKRPLRTRVSERRVSAGLAPYV